jgi:hypothetical protein
LSLALAEQPSVRGFFFAMVPTPGLRPGFRYHSLYTKYQKRR